MSATDPRRDGHGLRVVPVMSHRVVVMHGGKVVEQGSAEQIFAHPTHEYTRTLVAAAFEMKTAPSVGAPRSGTLPMTPKSSM